MTSDLRSLLGAAIQPGATNVSRRPGARRLLEDCWTPIRNAIEPRFADILLETLGPLAKSDDEDENKPAKIILSRDKAFLQAFSEAAQAEFKHFVADFCAHRSDERAEGKKGLSLVEYGDMEFSTLMERASARLRNACDEEYTSVKLRLANLVRETEIRDTENPFRPMLFFRAIYLGLENLGIAKQDLLRLTKRFDTSLIGPVAAAYAGVDRHLASQGISAELARQQMPMGRNDPLAGRNTIPSPFGSTVVPGMLTGNPMTGMRLVTGFSAEQMLHALYQRMQLVAAPVAYGMPGGMGGGMVGGVPGGVVGGVPGGVAMPGARYAPAPTIGGTGIGIPGVGGVAGGGFPGMGPVVGGVPVGGVPVGGVAVGGGQVGVGGGGPGVPGAAFVIDPTLLAALNDAQRIGAISLAAVQQGQPAPDAGVDPVLLRAKVADKASKQVDKLTIEIVGLLFDRINQDRHVPAEIKQLLQRLQFPLIKVALVDPELFVSPDQPARELLDRIAATSVGWTPKGEQNRRYLAEVQRAVHTVLASTEEGLAPFQRALDGFERYLLDENTRDDDPVARAKRALAEAEELEVLAINATIKIRSAFDGVLLEGYLREFLLETWPRVLVAATLRDKSEGLMRKYLGIVPDLVWSVQPKINPEDRKRLVTTIPPVLTTLREGLTMIDVPKPKMQEFFSRLMNSHAQAVKALELAHGAAQAAPFEASTLRIKLDGLKLTTADATPPDDGEMTIPDDAVKHAIEAAHLDVNYLTASGQTMAQGEDMDIDRRIASFKRGDWFDLQVGGAHERVQLKWFTPRRALYLFVGSSSARTHSLTPSTLRQFLRDGRISPVEGVPLFDRALREMMDELQRMSVEPTTRAG